MTIFVSHKQNNNKVILGLGRLLLIKKKEKVYIPPHLSQLDYFTP